MKKILYLNNVCWEWILQRPQIIALMLQKDNQCMVVNKSFVFGHKMADRNERPINEKIIKLLPKAEKFRIVSLINRLLYKLQLPDCNSYDIVWVCYPELAEYIPDNYKGKIVYDCMDDYTAMASETDRYMLSVQEEKIVQRANLIFTSSLNLYNKFSKTEKTVLCRNGYLNSLVCPMKDADVKLSYRIGYFGTISLWMNFELLVESCRTADIEYHLLGPCDKMVNKQEYQNDKIIFEGLIEHDRLYEKVKEYDALIMPFKLSKVIFSVDPVKLYEYISFGKCIISVWYPEIERFEPFVYFYHDAKEYTEILQRLCENGFPPKYSDEQRKMFLDCNSWENRYEILSHEIENL